MTITLRNLYKVGAFFAMLMALTFGMAQVAEAQERPEQVIRQTSDQLFATLKAEKANLQRNPDRIFSIVENILVPRFDFGTISQWVMGRSWRTATPAQRTEFTQEFKRLLINSYAGVLLEYTDEKIEILPLPANAANANELTVRSQIISKDRPPVAINYSMIKSGQRWMVYDVAVEGISIVANYRSEIRELVARNGIDGMINVLKQKNK